MISTHIVLIEIANFQYTVYKYIHTCIHTYFPQHQLLDKSHSNLGGILDKPEDSQKLISILLDIAENCNSNVLVQQYVFTRFEEILGVGIDLNDKDAAAYGIKHASKFLATNSTELRSKSFVDAMRSTDLYVQKSASAAFAILLSSHSGNSKELVHWIQEKFSSSTNDFELALLSLTLLAKKDTLRKEFIVAGGISNVVNKLNNLGPNGNAQQIYELSFILWCLSLNCNGSIDYFTSCGAIPTMVDLIAAAPSRKVVRMAIAMLKNLATTDDKRDTVLMEMLTVELDKILGTIILANAHKQAGDVEVENDVVVLQDLLLKNYRDLSSFERWSSEIQSGSLRWGIVHTEKFWRENNKFMEASEFKLLKVLIHLLKSDNVVNQSIALYDLGEFSRFYPNGKLVVSQLGGKEKVMELLESDNADVQSYALQCISKLLVQNWEFMK